MPREGDDSAAPDEDADEDEADWASPRASGEYGEYSFGTTHPVQLPAVPATLPGAETAARGPSGGGPPPRDGGARSPRDLRGAASAGDAAERVAQQPFEDAESLEEGEFTFGTTRPVWLPDVSQLPRPASPPRAQDPGRPGSHGHGSPGKKGPPAFQGGAQLVSVREESLPVSSSGSRQPSLNAVSVATPSRSVSPRRPPTPPPAVPPAAAALVAHGQPAGPPPCPAFPVVAHAGATFQADAFGPGVPFAVPTADVFGQGVPFAVPTPFDGSQVPASQESVALAAAAVASHLTSQTASTAVETASPFSASLDAEAQFPTGAAIESGFGPFYEPKEPIHVWDEVDGILRDPRAPRWAAMGCIAVLMSGTALAAAVYFLFLQEVR